MHPAITEAAAPPYHHSRLDDAQAFVAGTLLVSLGALMLSSGQLMTGGTVGLAVLANYLFGVRFGTAFFVVNLPFIALAMRQMGLAFTLRSFVALGLLASVANALPSWIAFEHLSPVYAAVAGGLLVGVGLLILFRHRTSLGGFGVVAMYAHRRFGWSIGLTQLCLDAAVLLASLPVLPASQVAISTLGIAAVNLTLAINHRPGYYVSY